MQGEEILSQASTSANTTAAEEEEEEEDAGGGEESEEEESDVVRGKGGLVNNHINYNWWRAVGLCQWGKSSVRGRACLSRSLIYIKKDWQSKVNCTVYLYWILSIFQVLPVSIVLFYFTSRNWKAMLRMNRTVFSIEKVIQDSQVL